MAGAAKLKQENTALLRKVLESGAAYSKNDLARQTGLSFPTVSRIVDALAAAGEVRQAGAAASTGGRCAMRYVRDPAYCLFLCMRMEAQTLRWFVCDLSDACLEEREVRCGRNPLEDIGTILSQVRARYPRLAAAAFGLAGTLRQGTVTEMFGYPELQGVSLDTFFRERLDVPCAVVRDMHAAVRGYCKRSAGGLRALVCIYLGALGAGAGMALDGRVWEGAAGFAGELHYLPIRNNLEYAKNRFTGADMTAYYMQVIRAYAALVNPERIVLYSNELLADRTERIRRACRQTLPEQGMPEIVLSDEFTRDYEAGLCALARERMEETE